MAAHSRAQYLKGIQNVPNQMTPFMPRGQFTGMNQQMHANGLLPPSGLGFQNGGFQSQPNVGGPHQMYPPGGAFNLPQSGQIPLKPELNHYQGIHGEPYQMVPSIPQGQFMGMNQQMYANRLLPPSGPGFQNGGFLGQPNVGGLPQIYPPGGAFNRPQSGHMPQMPELNHYQNGNPNPTGMGVYGAISGNSSDMSQLPLPPDPPPSHNKT